MIDAVVAVETGGDNVRMVLRVQALQKFIGSEDGTNLLVAYKRAANILKKENWTGPQVMSSAEEQGIPQTGEEDPLVLVDDPILGEAVAEMASGHAGAPQNASHSSRSVRCRGAVVVTGATVVVAGTAGRTARRVVPRAVVPGREVVVVGAPGPGKTVSVVKV